VATKGTDGTNGHAGSGEAKNEHYVPRSVPVPPETYDALVAELAADVEDDPKKLRAFLAKSEPVYT
jgi:hypothetical protein